MKTIIIFSLLLGILFSGCTNTKQNNCDIQCIWDPCPGKHIPDENGCINCASPCLEEECSSDNDCVPAQCCHPTSCVPKNQVPDCEDVSCTEECRGGTMDCGQGSCVCASGKCQVEWTIPREKYCENDDDCTVQSTDNCCGREAVNKDYSEGMHQICLIICPEYTTKCENNMCVLVGY